MTVVKINMTHHSEQPERPYCIDYLSVLVCGCFTQKSKLTRVLR